MKQINKYMLERLHITKDTGNHNYNYHPKTRSELKELVNKLIKERGNNADLNDIDTSKITDMSQLFSNFRKFNGDISKWDVSNVEDMSYMFYNSAFNGDISGWDVSNVEDMTSMFAYSEFDCSNGDISIWNPRGHVITKNMFTATPKQNWKNIPKWFKD